MHERTPSDPAMLTHVTARQAERPVLYVGGGCLDASAELRALVARARVPVAQTLMGLGTYPASDPLALQARGAARSRV
jgi:acetolactate synthase-1/2/3 large subunit